MSGGQPVRQERRESYSGLNREELIERLTHAEDVCVLVGWTSAGDPRDDRQAALTQLWMRWARATDAADSRKANPHLDDDAIHALAEERRQTRRAVQAQIARNAR